VFHEDLAVEATKEVLRDIQDGTIGLETVGDRTPIGLGGKSSSRELLSPEHADASVIQTVRERIQDDRVILCCLHCQDWQRTTTVSRVRDQPDCPDCGSTRIAALNPWADEVVSAVKSGDKDDEQEKMTQRAYRSASLVQTHGKKAVIALAARASVHTTPPESSTNSARTRTSSTGTSSLRNASTPEPSRSGADRPTVPSLISTADPARDVISGAERGAAMDRERRRLLVGTAGGLAALAGCSSPFEFGSSDTDASGGSDSQNLGDGYHAPSLDERPDGWEVTDNRRATFEREKFGLGVTGYASTTVYEETALRDAVSKKTRGSSTGVWQPSSRRRST